MRRSGVLWASLAIFGVAFAFRIFVTVRFIGIKAPPKHSAAPDQTDYELYAYRLSQGWGYTGADGQYTAKKPPGTSLSLTPVYCILGRSFFAARIWFCLLSAATCLAVFVLGSQLRDARVALISAGWFAVYPGSFAYCLHFLSEVPFSLYVACATATTVACLRRSSVPWAIVAGACWGMAILTRGQLVFILPLPWVAVIWNRRVREKYSRILTLQTAVTVVIVGAWVLRNQALLGKAMLTSNTGTVFWGAHNDKVFRDSAQIGNWIPVSPFFENDPVVGNEVERNAVGWERGLEWVRNNVSRMPQLYIMKVARLLAPFETTENRLVYLAFGVAWLFTGPFVLIGILTTWRRDTEAWIVMMLPLLATLLSALVFYGSIRIRDSIASIYVVFAAAGVVYAWDRLRGKPRGVSRRDTALEPRSAACVVLPPRQ